MNRIQAQGVHHITFVGSHCEATIEVYQGALGMTVVFEQPNLDGPEETHLYFDPGDQRLITFFVRLAPGRSHRGIDRAQESQSCVPVMSSQRWWAFVSGCLWAMELDNPPPRVAQRINAQWGQAGVEFARALAEASYSGDDAVRQRLA